MPPKRRAQRGEIYWVKLPQYESVGTEQYKGRPCVILSSNAINNDHNLKGYIVAPLTTRLDKRSAPFRQEIETRIDGNTVKRLILLEQLRFISEKRLGDDPIGALNADALYRLEPGLRYILFLVNPMSSI